MIITNEENLKILLYPIKVDDDGDFRELVINVDGSEDW